MLSQFLLKLPLTLADGWTDRQTPGNMIILIYIIPCTTRLVSGDFIVFWREKLKILEAAQVRASKFLQRFWLALVLEKILKPMSIFVAKPLG